MNAEVGKRAAEDKVLATIRNTTLQLIHEIISTNVLKENI